MPKFIFPVLFLLGFSAAVQAIVIRHDTGYAQHLASESQFPAVFWLEQRSQRKICVATLIAKQWALTAAHCVEETGLGQAMQSQHSYAVNIGGAPAQIDAAIMHPNYQYRDSIDKAMLEVDLALLHLVSPLPSPAPLALYDTDDELNQVATFVGWGYFGLGTTGIQSDDGRLRKAQNRVESAMGSRLRFVFDDPRELGNGALPLEGLPGLGDSGGPALISTGYGFSVLGVAVGEVSVVSNAGQEQGHYGAIAVYERISMHKRWIDATIASFVGS